MQFDVPNSPISKLAEHPGEAAKFRKLNIRTRPASPSQFLAALLVTGVLASSGMAFGATKNKPAPKAEPCASQGGVAGCEADVFICVDGTPSRQSASCKGWMGQGQVDLQIAGLNEFAPAKKAAKAGGESIATKSAGNLTPPPTSTAGNMARSETAGMAASKLTSAAVQMPAPQQELAAAAGESASEKPKATKASKKAKGAAKAAKAGKSAKAGKAAKAKSSRKLAKAQSKKAESAGVTR